MGCPAPTGAAPHPACAASRLDPLATAVHKLSNARNDSVGVEAHSIQHGSVPDGGENQPGVLPHLLRRTLPAKAASKLPEANVAKPQSQEDKAALPQMEVRVEEAPTEPLATSTPKEAPPTEVVEVAVKDEDVGRKQQDLEEEFPCPKGKPISYGPPVPLQVAAAQPQRAEPAAPVQPAETPAMEEEAEQTDEEAQALVRLQAALEVFQKMEGASKPPVPEGEPELGDFVILAKDVEPYGLCYAVITEAGEGRL